MGEESSIAKLGSLLRISQGCKKDVDYGLLSANKGCSQVLAMQAPHNMAAYFFKAGACIFMTSEPSFKRHN